MRSEFGKDNELGKFNTHLPHTGCGRCEQGGEWV